MGFMADNMDTGNEEVKEAMIKSFLTNDTYLVANTKKECYGYL